MSTKIGKIESNIDKKEILRLHQNLNDIGPEISKKNQFEKLVHHKKGSEVALLIYVGNAGSPLRGYI